MDWRKGYDNGKGQTNRTAPAEGTNHLPRKTIVSSHKVIKTIAEINERIKKGKAVVLNAEEMVEASGAWARKKPPVKSTW